MSACRLPLHVLLLICFSISSIGLEVNAEAIRSWNSYPVRHIVQEIADEDSHLKFCPVGKCRFFAESEGEVLDHALNYHGINSTDFYSKTNGSKECVAKIIYRRKTSVWHARLVSSIYISDLVSHTIL